MTRAVDPWAWLEAREPGIPASLRERMRAAVLVIDRTGDTAADLGAAAAHCLRSALEAGDDRTAALHLLAADALLTHGAEAAAEADALEAFARTYGAGALRRRFLAGPAA